MKAILACLVGLFAIASFAFAETPAGWSDNLEKSLAKAKAEKKDVLIEFTGSDWCPPCVAMRKMVFTQKAFIQKASKKFILVELDLPKGNKALEEKNTPLAEKYKVEVLPVVILLTSQGKEFGRFYAAEYPETKLFLARLDEALEKKDMD